ncbi:MAG: hypothetical protein MJ175_01490 [Clostridia bacterium]|nr:hypothetical protein [Clostridia bacterium]
MENKMGIFTAKGAAALLILGGIWLVWKLKSLASRVKNIEMDDTLELDDAEEAVYPDVRICEAEN